MKDIFQRELDGEPIATSDPDYAKIIGTITETMNALSAYNQRPPFDSGNRAEISKILGAELDESSAILPPFYADFGKNIKIGKNVWIQQGCTFFDRGGIEIDDDTFIAPKVNLITLNHVANPYERSTTVSKPIKIGKRVWIGIAATVLAGVTIGDNAIVGAGSVVTHDVESNTVVAGNPARVIKRLEQFEPNA